MEHGSRYGKRKQGKSHDAIATGENGIASTGDGRTLGARMILRYVIMDDECLEFSNWVSNFNFKYRMVEWILHQTLAPAKKSAIEIHGRVGSCMR